MSESIQSIARAFTLLQTIANHDNAISLTELSKRSGLHKSTVHRILGTLIDIGYVKQNPLNSHYELTVKLFEIGSMVIKNNTLTTIAKPFLEQLRDLSGEVVHLVIPDKYEIVYVDKVESLHTLRMHSYIGKRSPMYCTAVGKAILALHTNTFIKTYWQHITPVKHTPYTLTTLDTFLTEIERIRSEGVSYDNEEYETDIRCIAISLINHSEEPVGAISISGPKHRMTDAHIQSIIPELIRVKHAIKNHL